jgi:hypothetical protein
MMSGMACNFVRKGVCNEKHFPAPRAKVESGLIGSYPAGDLPGVGRGLVGWDRLCVISRQLYATGSEGDLEFQGVPQDDFKGVPLAGSEQGPCKISGFCSVQGARYIISIHLDCQRSWIF